MPFLNNESVRYVEIITNCLLYLLIAHLPSRCCIRHNFSSTQWCMHAFGTTFGSCYSTTSTTATTAECMHLTRSSNSSTCNQCVSTGCWTNCIKVGKTSKTDERKALFFKLGWLDSEPVIDCNPSKRAMRSALWMVWMDGTMLPCMHARVHTHCLMYAVCRM